MMTGFEVVPPIPSDTFAAARRIYNIQHVYLKIGDHLADILAGVDLRALDMGNSQNEHTIFRQALVTAFQYAELLADPLAAEATLTRMDWKYALYLPIKYPGITSAALCEFRRQMYEAPRGLLVFSNLLNQLSAYGLFSRRARLKLDPNSALTTICKITRLYQLHRAVREALSLLGTQYREWLLANALPYWYDRYKTSGTAKLTATGSLIDPLDEANTLGGDIDHLLTALQTERAPRIADHPEIGHLAALFAEQYQRQEDGTVVWRPTDCITCLCNQM